MDNLKPCPFCGGSDIYETYSQEYAGTKNPEIFCNSCKIIFAIENDSPYMKFDEDYVYRKAKTVEAWNRRKRGKWIRHGVEEGYLIEKYTCSECGYYSGTKTSNFCPDCGSYNGEEKTDNEA